MDGGPNHRNKAALSNFSGLVNGAERLLRTLRRNVAAFARASISFTVVSIEAI